MVTGPPCAGKTTHVQKHKANLDVVVDLDAIAFALGYPEHQVEWGSEHPAIAAARMARAHVIAALLGGRVHARAWIIDAAPDDVAGIKYERAQAEVVTIDPGIEVCLDRAESRPAGTRERVEAWYGVRPSTTTSGPDDHQRSVSVAPALSVFGRP